MAPKYKSRLGVADGVGDIKNVDDSLHFDDKGKLREPEATGPNEFIGAADTHVTKKPGPSDTSPTSMTGDFRSDVEQSLSGDEFDDGLTTNPMLVRIENRDAGRNEEVTSEHMAISDAFATLDANWISEVEDLKHVFLTMRQIMKDELLDADLNFVYEEALRHYADLMNESPFKREDVLWSGSKKALAKNIQTSYPYIINTDGDSVYRSIFGVTDAFEVKRSRIRRVMAKSSMKGDLDLSNKDIDRSYAKNNTTQLVFVADRLAKFERQAPIDIISADKFYEHIPTYRQLIEILEQSTAFSTYYGYKPHSRLLTRTVARESLQFIALELNQRGYPIPRYVDFDAVDEYYLLPLY